jgi:hypothetical protein
MGLAQYINRLFKSSSGLETHSSQETLQIPIELYKGFGSFSIIPRVYEKELDKKYGIVLRKLKNGKPMSFRKDLRKNISFNEGYGHSLYKIEDRILKKYSSVPGFCSMDIDSMEDLSKHIRDIHEISYSHYAWAKEANLEGSFPNSCCGSSSRNICLTLMDKGYPNSSIVSNGEHDHTYVALPFLLREKREKGFVIVDPTSDQLFTDKKNAPRNNLFVFFGGRWSYETDWGDGGDLFPYDRGESGFSNLHTLRKHPDSWIYMEEEEIGKYFREVFKNPVKLK